MEWSEKIPRITQNSKPKLGDGWICSKSFGEVSLGNDEIDEGLMTKKKIQIGWDNFFY